MVKYLRAIGFDSARRIAGFVFCLTAVLATSQTAANEIAQWNDTTMKAIAANGQNNLVSTRTLAMVQVAVHDALNAISRRYDAYYFEGPADPAASPDATVPAAPPPLLVGRGRRFRPPQIRQWPTRRWSGAICRPLIRAGSTSRPSPCCRPRSSGCPGRRH